ncbi:MAG: hypothetical protein ABUS54_10085 [Actinomycetota bacterium]
MRFEALETMRDAGFYVSDIGQALQYRPDLFGGPFSAFLQELMRERASDWSVGERELFAAFASALRQCPF